MEQRTVKFLAGDVGVREAAARLKHGEVVAFPTETVYGLGANAFDEAAVARVFALKGRPTHHPLIVHVLDLEQARQLTTDFGALGERLAQHFWPGPLTLIVPRAPRVSTAITGGLDTVAIRAPKHPLARALIAAFGGPLVAPSANRYQTLSPTTAAHVAKSFGKDAPLILDGGRADEGIESTVVDLTISPPQLLRPGAVTLAQLQAVAPSIVARVETIATAATHKSPGQDARHYAPNATLRLHCDRATMLARAVDSSIGFLFRKNASAILQRAGAIELPNEARAYAHELFYVLHTLDDLNVREIWVEELPTSDEWLAVRDRLQRAATVT